MGYGDRDGLLAGAQAGHAGNRTLVTGKDVDPTLTASVVGEIERVGLACAIRQRETGTLREQLFCPDFIAAADLMDGRFDKIQLIPSAGRAEASRYAGPARILMDLPSIAGRWCQCVAGRGTDDPYPISHRSGKLEDRVSGCSLAVLRLLQRCRLMGRNGHADDCGQKGNRGSCNGMHRPSPLV